MLCCGVELCIVGGCVYMHGVVFYCVGCCGNDNAIIQIYTTGRSAVLVRQGEGKVMYVAACGGPVQVVLGMVRAWCGRVGHGEGMVRQGWAWRGNGQAGLGMARAWCGVVGQGEGMVRTGWGERKKKRLSPSLRTRSRMPFSAAKKNMKKKTNTETIKATTTRAHDTSHPTTYTRP